MASLMGFVWLSLISTILVGLAAKANGQEWRYVRCEPHEIRTDLGESFVPKGVSIDNLRLILADSKGKMIGGLKAEELLALGEVSEEKCKLAEFATRFDYEEIYSESAVEEFIKESNKELKVFCKERKKKELSEEFKKATKEDESIIRSIFRKAGTDDEGYQSAADEYVKSMPGTQDFVLQARQLRILHACNNMARYALIAGDFIELGWYLEPVCSSLRNKFSLYRRKKTSAAQVAKDTAYVVAVVGAAAGAVTAGILVPQITAPIVIGGFLVAQALH